MAIVGLAGCLSPATATPVTIPQGARCDRCGMEIHAHPGPTAQVFFRDASPHEREGPAWFDSTWEAYQFVFEHEAPIQGWFVTDYSVIDPAIEDDGGVPTIERAVRADSFLGVEKISYVVDSRVVGAMGRDLIGFGQQGDAMSFQQAYGGSVLTHEAITPEVVGLLGR